MTSQMYLPLVVRFFFFSYFELAVGFLACTLLSDHGVEVDPDPCERCSASSYL